MFKIFLKVFLKLFGAERVAYVLAATVQENETDGRYVVSNKEWAKTIKSENTEEELRTISVGSHPAIVDGLISYLRKHVLEQAKELGRAFSCISSTPKYNAEYLERIVKTKWLKKLENMENAHKKATA